jgi:hypothetical protein
MYLVKFNLGDAINWLTAIGILAGAVAAFVAVWVALKTHRESQAFARASMRPILEFTTFFDANKYLVVMHNAGQGPAIVTSTRAIFNGTSRELKKTTDIDAVLSQLAHKIGFFPITISRFIAQESTALQPNREITILRTGFREPITENQSREIPEILYFEVSYQSLFGDEFTARSD